MEFAMVVKELAKQCGRSEVLIVDENCDDLNYYSEIIEAQGFRVHRYRSYHEAIYFVLVGRRVDLAVVDQGSSAFEGRVVLQYLGPLVPFVVLTRSRHMQCYIEAMELGATDYLEKPVSPAHIERALHECLGNGRRSLRTPSWHRNH
jgi:DNA-binding NtrC family response regulator